MSSGTGIRRAVLALAAPAVLALALPAAEFHDHPDRPDTECRICEVSTVHLAVVREGVPLPAPTDEFRAASVETPRETAPPVLRGCAARAPPA